MVNGVKILMARPAGVHIQPRPVQPMIQPVVLLKAASGVLINMVRLAVVGAVCLLRLEPLLMAVQFTINLFVNQRAVSGALVQAADQVGARIPAKNVRLIPRQIVKRRAVSGV